MNTEIDTKKIKRKIYMSYFQDGLWDILLGLFLLGWGLSILYDVTWLPGATFIVFFWSVLGLKQKITYPRIGFAKPVEHRRQMLMLIIAGVVALVLGIFIMVVFAAGGVFAWVRDYVELIFGSLLAIPVAFIGNWWRNYRWYFFAGLLFILAVINQWSALSFWLSFVIPGVIILIWGLVVLTRFLRKYPRTTEVDLNGSR